ncbi:hypothetical protein ECAE60S_00118 [Eoetvoesiella caeni]
MIIDHEPERKPRPLAWGRASPDPFSAVSALNVDGEAPADRLEFFIA